MVTKLPDIGSLTAEQGLLEKAMQGTVGWAEINKRDGLELLGFLSYTSGSLGAVGTVIDATVSGMKAGSEMDNQQKLLGVDLEREAKENLIAREALNEKDEKIKDAAGNALVSGAVGIGAGAAALAVAGPVGWLAGAAIGIGANILGSVSGSKIYDVLLKTESKDTLALLAKVAYAQAEGVAVPEEAVGAVLLSTLPEATRKGIEDKLERKTGTRSFHKALQEEKYDVIRELMVDYDPNIRHNIMGKTIDADFDKNDAGMTVAQQLTPLINNSGKLNAVALAFDNANIATLQAMLDAEILTTQGVVAGGDVDTPTSGLSRSGDDGWIAKIKSKVKGGAPQDLN